MERELLLITGRTAKQGAGLGLGKFSGQYRDEVLTIELNTDDMSAMGLGPGDWVDVQSSAGLVRLKCRAGELAPGIAFVPYGRPANLLVSGDTGGTGMPDFKGMLVTLRPRQQTSGEEESVY